jgi:CRISPR-associated protein Csx17
VPDLVLEGCVSRPLVGYLKALGLLRVVARQADPRAAGRWTQGIFELRSELDRSDLERFLLDEYAPSPVLSPWNGSSGFFPPKDRTDALQAVEGSSDPRFSTYRDAVAAARAALHHHGLVQKPTGDQKQALLRTLRRELPDDALDWLDAALVMTGSEVAFPPLLGSGGNDGHYEFSNNYLQAVVKATLDPQTRTASLRWLVDALGGAPAEQEGMSLGHFLRDASPVNSPTGESDSLGNPWDLVLAVEGSLILVAGAARRHDSGAEAALVAPFTAQTTGAGYRSSVSAERDRAELWLPLWSRSASLREIEALAREARAQVGRRRARTDLDFVRAAGDLGVARGIAAFERYAIVERAGQARLAVSIGRVTVTDQPSAHALHSVDHWLERAVSFAGSKSCPQAVATAIRRLERDVFALAQRADVVLAGRVLERFGAVESALARSARRASKAGLSPLSGVPAEPWLEIADDASAEFAVALSLASLRNRRGEAIRDALHGTSRVEERRRTFDPEGRSRVSGSGGLVDRLAELHARCAMEGSRAGPSRDAPPPARAFEKGLPCDPTAARGFARGALRDERIERLLAGLCLLDFSESRPRGPLGAVALPAPPFDLLALAWAGTREVPLEPRSSWAARLRNGAVEPVLADAALRLRMAMLPPAVTPRDLMTDRPDGTRLAASLLLPLSLAERSRIARRLTMPATTTTEETQ